LARTNPSRPVVDIPVFIGELGDLPRLVQRAGGGLIRELASANLSYQFGIKPLVSDLTAMLDFVDHVDKRMTELRALQESGLRRKRNLASGSANATVASDPTNTAPIWVNVDCRIRRTTLVKTWGFVRWFPTGDFPATDRALLKLARRSVMGLTIDGSTAWELIPFSWLADWFSNTGDLLKANRNIVPCTHGPVNIMRRSYTEHRYSVISDTTGRYDRQWTIHRETKSRVVATATLQAHMPLLSLRQLSILGSLIVLRSGRY